LCFHLALWREVYFFALCQNKDVDRDGFLHGIGLFNHAEFFDAHEVLEDVWRATTGEEKKFLQGLIQVAVAFHHHSTGNKVGACSLLARSAKNLDSYPGNFAGIRLTALLESLAQWREALDSGSALPSLPRIEML
jgi:predicted metal-dependent hydrolase